MALSNIYTSNIILYTCISARITLQPSRPREVGLLMFTFVPFYFIFRRTKMAGLGAILSVPVGLEGRMYTPVPASQNHAPTQGMTGQHARLIDCLQSMGNLGKGASGLFLDKLMVQLRPIKCTKNPSLKFTLCIDCMLSSRIKRFLQPSPDVSFLEKSRVRGVVCCHGARTRAKSSNRYRG